MRNVYCSPMTLDLPEDFGIIHFTERQAYTFAVILGVVLLGLMLWGGISVARELLRRKSQNADFLEKFSEASEADLPPLTELHAVVTAKDAQIVHTGNAKAPSHRIRYQILFTLENNETRILDVPQEAFEQIHKNQIGTLVLQEEEFFDFSVD